MEHLSIAVAAQCSSCGAAGTESHTQSCYGERLSYNIGFSCDVCGNRWCAIGDAPSAAVHRRMIAAAGIARLSVVAVGSRLSPVVRIIADELGVPVAEALRLAKCATPIFTGTPVEIECLARRLRSAGATVQVTS